MLLISIALSGAAGCGGDSADPGGSQTDGPPQKRLFVERCGSCHAFSAAGTESTAGPDLGSMSGLDRRRVLAAIREGPGTMPENLLQGREARELAAWVAANAR